VVHHDGVGGAVLGGTSRTGPASPTDRIDALEGHLVLDSPSGPLRKSPAVEGAGAPAAAGPHRDARPSISTSFPDTDWL
jgi:hypothetical protein